MTIPDQFIAEEDYAIAWWAAGVSNPDPSAGDYDGNGTIGPEDYLVWKSNFGTTNPDADGNGDGLVNAADYVHWRNILAASGTGTLSGTSVPEPAPGVALLVAAWIVTASPNRVTHWKMQIPPSSHGGQQITGA